MIDRGSPGEHVVVGPCFGDEGGVFRSGQNDSVRAVRGWWLPPFFFPAAATVAQGGGALTAHPPPPRPSATDRGEIGGDNERYVHPPAVTSRADRRSRCSLGTRRARRFLGGFTPSASARVAALATVACRASVRAARSWSMDASATALEAATCGVGAGMRAWGCVCVLFAAGYVIQLVLAVFSLLTINDEEVGLRGWVVAFLYY